MNACCDADDDPREGWREVALAIVRERVEQCVADMLEEQALQVLMQAPTIVDAVMQLPAVHMQVERQIDMIARDCERTRPMQ